MKKNSNQIDLFSADNKSNQSKNILTAIDIGSDKIVCFIAKIDEITREKRALRVVGSGYCQSKGIRNGKVIDQKEAEKSIRLALDKAEKDANQILDFTREIKNTDDKFKNKIVESLWNIIFSDGSSDMYEANFMRRLTGLIYLNKKVVGDIKEKIKNKQIK